MSPVNKLPLPPPPHSAPLPAEEVHAGRRLTEALVQVAAEHARDQEVPDSVVVAAPSSALGCVAAAIARSNDFHLARYEELVAARFTRAFQADSARPHY